ncbi:MAG TPA: hypothetical protein VK436_02740 [Methanocella sp.]|nr:hypothetical protein [Methanocella sp.]
MLLVTLLEMPLCVSVILVLVFFGAAFIERVERWAGKPRGAQAKPPLAWRVLGCRHRGRAAGGSFCRAPLGGRAVFGDFFVGAALSSGP